MKMADYKITYFSKKLQIADENQRLKMKITDFR